MLSQDKVVLQTYDLFDSNRIKILVAGFQTIAMVDSGATVSVIDRDFLKKINVSSQVSCKNANTGKKCLLADGSEVILNTTVKLPLKLKQVTIEVEFYILTMKQIPLILGCDILTLMNAKLDFQQKQLILTTPKHNIHISCLHTSTLGQLEVCEQSQMADDNEMNVSLKVKLAKINLRDSQVNVNEKRQLISLLNSYDDVFANNLSELGRTNIIEYDIEVPYDAKPIKLPQYKYPYKHRDTINIEVQKLLDADLAHIARDNKWLFPSLLVSKPRSTQMRMCIDFRKLNAITPLNPQPPFDMNHFMCDLGKQNCKYFSVLDLKSAFNQVPLSKKSQEICTFSSPMGCIRLKTCPFGLKNLPAVFTKLMDIIFLDIKNTFMVFYLDDVIIFSKTFEDHLQHLGEVFKRLRRAKLTVEPAKTHLFQMSVVFLGVRISAHGIETEESNIEKVKAFPLNNTQKSVKGFLGLTNYYRKHIKDYSRIAAPLFELTKKYSGKFQLTPQAIESYKTLKEKLITAPILTFPRLGDKDPPLNLTVDSSRLGVGWVMSQPTYSEEIGKMIDKPIYYGSKNFNKYQQKLGSTELETLGLTIAVKKLDTYLRGRFFNIYTDHKAILHIMTKKMDELKASFARKVMFLSQYEFKIFHREGKSISNADALSRTIHTNPSDLEEDAEPELYAIVNKEIQQKPVLEFTDINLEKLTKSNIKKGQKKDYFFRSMYDFIKHDTISKDTRMSKRIKNNSNQYVINNDILYHLWQYKSGHTQYSQVCIPEELRTTVMQALHDLKTTGHASTMKMYHSAIRRLWWPGMYASFENYVKSCKTCLESNKGHDPKIKLKPLEVAHSVFDTIHIDLLSIQTPSNGFKYMLVIIDSFSKMIVVKCLKSKHGNIVARSIFQEWFMRYGIPRKMCYTVHDNGLELVNKWTKALYEIINVKSIRISAYKPSSNSQVEVTNKYILSILRKLTKDEPKKWSSLIPSVVMAINSSVSETTKYSPFKLVHGVDIIDVLDLQLPYIPDNIPKNKQQAYSYWSENLSKIRKQAESNMKIAKEIQKKNYDKHATSHSFKVGDHVYIKVERWNENEDSKLKNFYKGRYKIVNFLSDTNVILEDETGKQLPRSIYINKLKKCKLRRQKVNKEVTNESNCETEESDSNTIIEDSSKSESEIENSETNSLSNTESEDNDSTASHDEIDELTVPDTILSKHTEIESKLKDQHSEPQSEIEIDNIPTEQFFNDESHKLQDSKAFMPINKVYRKRILSDGTTQYYVSYKKYPAKKDRVWVNEADMTPELQSYAKNRKLQLTKANLNMLQEQRYNVEE